MSFYLTFTCLQTFLVTHFYILWVGIKFSIQSNPYDHMQQSFLSCHILKKARDIQLICFKHF